MTSREWFHATLNPQPPGHVCVDFGATFVTGNILGNVPLENVEALFRAVRGSAQAV